MLVGAGVTGAILIKEGDQAVEQGPGPVDTKVIAQKVEQESARYGQALKVELRTYRNADMAVRDAQDCNPTTSWTSRRRCPSSPDALR